MVDFITAIGLVFVIEGLFYVIAPNRLKTMIAMMEDIPPETLRNLGVLAVGIGVAIVWLAKSLLSS